MDNKETKSDSSFRYYVRVNLIFMLVLLAVAAAITAWHPTVPRVAGLVLAATMTVLVFFINRVSPRRFGFGMLATAGVLAVTGEFARPGWGMEPYEFGVGAVGLGALALGLIFANEKTAEADTRFENGVGALVLLGLLAVTGIVVWRGAPGIAHPAGLVFVEALGALADVAGERWRWRLALAAIFPITVLAVSYAKPEQLRVFYRLHSGYAFLCFHSHSWMIWPILFAGFSSLIASANRRRGWHDALARLLVIAISIWLLLFVADIAL